MSTLRSDADKIISEAIAAVLPENAVKTALKDFDAKGRVHIIAIGKAAWRMADAAVAQLEGQVTGGVVITKYGHSQGDIKGLTVLEAGHPIVDENSVKAADCVLDYVRDLDKGDEVLFLVSGGGSALFESPLVSLDEMQDISRQLLACGADIVEINTIRKRLSAVKGGRFARACAPAKVYAVILSDIVGDPLDMIASGPAAVDHTSCEDAFRIVEKYSLRLSERAMELMGAETEKNLDNVTSVVIGSVTQLCANAAAAAERLGYKAQVLDTALACEARDYGRFLAEKAGEYCNGGENIAFIAGGETVVKLTGKGLGGRNQELAFAAVRGLSGISNACIFSVGSDGTDGPTDAAGGYADGSSLELLQKKGIDPDAVLADNDSYHALKTVDGLVVTGPTGTNVNDFCALLVRAE